MFTNIITILLSKIDPTYIKMYYIFHYNINILLCIKILLCINIKYIMIIINVADAMTRRNIILLPITLYFTITLYYYTETNYYNIGV